MTADFAIFAWRGTDAAREERIADHRAPGLCAHGCGETLVHGKTGIYCCNLACPREDVTE